MVVDASDVMAAIMPPDKIDVKRKVYVFIIEKVDSGSAQARAWADNGRSSVARAAPVAVKIRSKPNTGTT
jgi:hypothetical protein